MEVPFAIRKQIINHYVSGEYTQRQISVMVQVPTSTINDIVKHYRETGEVKSRRKSRTGRPKKLGVRDERALARYSVAHPRATARQIKHEVGGAAATVSISTIKRSLVRMGRISQRPLSAPNLSPSQRHVRLQWCRRYCHWSEEQWQKVRH